MAKSQVVFLRAAGRVLGEEHSLAALERDDLVEGVESPAAAAVIGTDVRAVGGDGAEDWDVVKGVNPCCDLCFRVSMGRGEDENGVIEVRRRSRRQQCAGARCIRGCGGRVAAGS